MEEISIRMATVEDLECLLHHRRAMFKEMGYRDIAVLDRMQDLSRDYFSEALRTGAYTGWFAEGLNGRILGGGGIVLAAWPGFPGEPTAERAWILNMYTEPAARRRGIARRLIAVMLEWCRTKGFRTVSLHASDAGRPLYESHGFQPTNEMTLKLR